MLTEQELNTVLACIRYCQHEGVNLSGMDHFAGEGRNPLPWDKVDDFIEEKLYDLCDFREQDGGKTYTCGRLLRGQRPALGNPRQSGITHAGGGGSGRNASHQ
jgi:hypothetical protein